MLGKDTCNEYNWKRVSTWNLKVLQKERSGGGRGRRGRKIKDMNKQFMEEEMCIDNKRKVNIRRALPFLVIRKASFFFFLKTFFGPWGRHYFRNLTVFMGSKRWWKHPKCLLTNEWTNKRLYTYVMEYYSSFKRKGILSCNVAWMNLENMMLNEGSQLQRDQ